MAPFYFYGEGGKERLIKRGESVDIEQIGPEKTKIEVLSDDLAMVETDVYVQIGNVVGKEKFKRKETAKGRFLLQRESVAKNTQSLVHSGKIRPQEAVIWRKK
jgi:hypothetical protein